MVSHIKEKADSILIILSAQGAVNYFLVGTFVPSNFLCILIVLHVSFLVLASVVHTFLVLGASSAKTGIANTAIINNVNIFFIVVSF